MFYVFFEQNSLAAEPLALFLRNDSIYRVVESLRRTRLFPPDAVEGERPHGTLLPRSIVING